MSKKAIVLLSGGQDSTTSLVWALKRGGFKESRALNFFYGQRHKVEMESAFNIAMKLGVKYVEKDLKAGFSILEGMGDKEKSYSSLLSDSEINQPHPQDSSLPSSFVPGRNIAFFFYAGIYAYWRGIHDIVSGVCQTDYSGYPDCRREFVDSMEQALSRGLQYEIKIHTPLMFLSKAESIKLMVDMGYLWLLAYTHTCYNGKKPPCGECPACKVRARGFKEAGIKDPLL